MARPLGARRRFVPLAAGIAAVGVVATLAVVLDGYDAQEVPALSTSVWVTRDSGQYARVNTELGEIDTVRSVEDPDGVVQNGDAGLIFTQGYGRVWPIDPATPGDLSGSAVSADGAVEAGDATPTGTRDVVQSGSWVAYFTTTGRTYLSALVGDGEPPLPTLVDPFRDVTVPEGEEAPSYVATVMAVDENGLVAMYSAAESAVRVYDARRDTFRDAGAVESPPDPEARLQISVVGGRWALLDADEGLLWLEGTKEPIVVDVGAEAVLQASSAAGSDIHLADADGLLTVDGASGDSERLAEGGGTPARPIVVGGDVVAAWLSSSSGHLWTTQQGEVPLEVEGDELEDLDAIVPVLRSNGDRAVLNETASGMLWSVPDGTLIPVEQWTLDDDNDRDAGTIQVDDVAEQEPPVAVADTFGVRPGALVSLPVLLNDHDPNKKDVLTIVPESIQYDAAFGSVSLAGGNQQAVVRVTGGGSSTFSYAVTDGVSISAPAIVTVTVVGDVVNTAPEWCGVEACVQEWPAPGLSAGGSVTVPVLAGWVDHEGDVIVLADATKDDPDAPVSVVATADGSVVVRHQDPNAGDAIIPITVTVADSRGATSTRALEVRVTANPALVAEPIAAVAGVDEKVSVDLARHVRGGSGSFTIVDAVQTSTGGGLVVVPNAASNVIELSAGTPGDYVVTYTVQDLVTQAQQSSILRLNVVRAGAPLSIAPITAFVRPAEDATVDVLAAVQNTTGRVLLVSAAASESPDLQATVVAQARVRVSGSTPDGRPGLIGTATVTVTDGAGNSVDGTVSVFLVAASTATSPIAVPDTATVRAGTQVDIPVLANDVSPRGERVSVHPDLQGSGTEGELAFVAGDRVRYLAPPVPGVYTLRYSVYLENSPQLLDNATVTVTVLPRGTNREPQPRILTARVIAGQSVAIPFADAGIDPDGDRVVLADVTQPESGQGIAEITAEGDAIVYTAPGNGVRGGQVSFAYRVRDAEGSEAEGVVRVGVLATELSDVAPVTYGDYVRVQAGTTAPLTVSPLLNDRDPRQGRLELLRVVPNAVEGTAEYTRLDELLDTSALAQGEVRLSAGATLGVHSYVYTVESQTSFSTAFGLIVVKVTDAPSPDAPIVTDTVVTAQNRGQFASGIDVVTGKVQWASGDPDGLELELWGDAAARYTVEGRRISGPLPDDGDLVPFSLTGPTPGGGEVTSYGFLRIPAFDDMRIQLRSDVEPVPVGEEQSVEFAIRDLLDLTPGDDVEIRDDESFVVQRANSGCRPVSGTRASYTAGREAPWSDTCTIPVRIEGQRTWTMLGVPLVIEPKDPQALLGSISRTVAPGGTDTVDLYDQMTSWEGGRVGDIAALHYQVDYSGSAFLISQTANGTVQIDARADARPGTRETIRVTADAYGGLTAGISLTVGIAPADAPRGAVFTQRCDVSQGATCAIQVVDKSGEYDPFEGKVGSGLKLVSVGTDGSVSCPVATVRAADQRSVVATWPAGPKPVGGECVVTYTVADAQGRTGQGVVTIDVYGYPQRPASVTTSAYTGSGVTVRVDLGDARNAHPDVTGVVLYEGGSRVAASTCTPSGADYQCAVTGLTNGDNHTYTARAVNSVGDSLDTTAHTTHAYSKPQITGRSVESVYRSGTTNSSIGVVSLSITADDDAQAFRVLVNGTPVTTISRTGSTTTADLSLQPGTRLLEIVPISRFSPPIPGSNEGDAVTITAQPAGSALVSSSGTVTPGATSLTLNGATFSPNNSPDPLSVTYYAWRSGTPSCTSTPTGGQQVTGAEQTSVTATISGLVENEEYRVAACASYGFGAVATSPIESYTFDPPAAPTGPLSFTIATSPSGGQTKTYNVSGYSQPAAPPKFQTRYRVDGGSLQNSLPALSPNAPQTIEVLFCRTLRGNDLCSASTPMTAAAGGPPTAVQVVFPSCDALDHNQTDEWNANKVVGVGHAAGKFDVTVTVDKHLIFDEWDYDFVVTWTDPDYDDLVDLTYSATDCDN
jgi:hypothetical protein